MLQTDRHNQPADTLGALADTLGQVHNHMQQEKQVVQEVHLEQEKLNCFQYEFQPGLCLLHL